MFESPAKSELAKAHFVNLLKSEGWILFEKIVRANQELVKKQLIEGVENETKEEIDRKRDKIRIYEEVLNTPHSMMEKLSPSTTNQKEDDPYDTVESLAEKRMQR